MTCSWHLRSPPVFCGVRVTRSLVFCVMFCRSLFVLLYFFFFPLCCLSFDLDLRILIKPLWYLQTLLRIWKRKKLNDWFIHFVVAESTPYTYWCIKIYYRQTPYSHKNKIEKRTKCSFFFLFQKARILTEIIRIFYI